MFAATFTISIITSLLVLGAICIGHRIVNVVCELYGCDDDDD